eukprot:scaffold8014_cov125-Isochrysis_galbana.AAC.4
MTNTKFSRGVSGATGSATWHEQRHLSLLKASKTGSPFVTAEAVASKIHWVERIGSPSHGGSTGA